MDREQVNLILLLFLILFSFAFISLVVRELRPHAPLSTKYGELVEQCEEDGFREWECAAQLHPFLGPAEPAPAPQQEK